MQHSPFPPHPGAMNPQAMLSQQQAMANQAAQFRKRSHDTESLAKHFKKKRPTDRNMPPKIEAFVPESKLYMELTEFEKSLDATILRKRLDIQEALGKPTKLRRTLRVFVSNTSSDQSGLSNENGGESFDLTNGQAPSWTLKIEGTLLDSANSTNQSLPTPKFTSFFRSIVVDLERDPAVYPEGNVIEWHKQPGNADHDGIEIKRKGDTSVKARIILELDYNPPTFKLAPALASLLDMKQDIKPNIVMAIWDYVKHHKLQDAEDKRIIHCDQRLMQIFGAPQIHFSQLPDLINRHLARPDPIVIPYTIRVDKPLHQSSNAFDIEVEQDSPLRQKMMEVIASSQMQKDVSGLDDKILQCVQSINNSKIKRDFLLQFSENPVDFINKWMASQARDLEVILGDNKANLEEMRQSDFYKQDWVKEAVFHYLTTKSQQRMQELIDSQRPPHP